MRLLLLLLLCAGCAAPRASGPATRTERVERLVEQRALAIPHLPDAAPVEDGASPVGLLTLESTGALRHDPLGPRAGAYPAPPPSPAEATPIALRPGLEADALTRTLRAAHRPGTAGAVVLEPTPPTPLLVLLLAARIARIEGFRRVYFSPAPTEPYAPAAGWPAALGALDRNAELLIQADRHTPWRRIYHLLAACRAAGVLRVAWLCRDQGGELVKVRTYLPGPN